MFRSTIADLTPDQLRDRAHEYRDMAADARTVVMRDALIRLAQGFEALAASREADERRD